MYVCWKIYCVLILLMGLYEVDFLRLISVVGNSWGRVKFIVLKNVLGNLFIICMNVC